MQTASVSLLEGAAEAIWELEREVRYQKGYRLALRQVAGALEYLLLKRFGYDQISCLNDAVVVDAYNAEVARVVRGWPETVDFVRPGLFYSISQTLRHVFHKKGWGDLPGDFAARMGLPNMLDQSGITTSVWDDGGRVLFACPNTLRVFSWCHEDQIDKLSGRLSMIHSSEVGNVQHDVDAVRDGSTIENVEYRCVFPGVNRIHVLLAKSVFDDDHIQIGQLWITRPILSRAHVEITSRPVAIPYVTGSTGRG